MCNKVQARIRAHGVSTEVPAPPKHSNHATVALLDLLLCKVHTLFTRTFNELSEGLNSKQSHLTDTNARIDLVTFCVPFDKA